MMRRKPRTLVGSVVVMVLPVLALLAVAPGEAPGKRDSAAASVRVSGARLTITAAPGARDNLIVTRPSPSTVVVTDYPDGFYTGSRVRAGAGCTQSGRYGASCAAAVARILLSARDRADRVSDSTGIRAAMYGGGADDEVSGGSADDTLVGGAGDDTVVGGPGADVLQGMGGDDLLLARDQTSDARIDCDGGTGGGKADRAVLDALPKDPGAVVAGCEQRLRPR